LTNILESVYLEEEKRDGRIILRLMRGSERIYLLEEVVPDSAGKN
jgi:hypothetical protein